MVSKRRRRFTFFTKKKRARPSQTTPDKKKSAGGPCALTGAPAVPSRAGPRGHRLAGSKRPGGGGGAPRLDAAGRGCSPQPRGGRARQPRGSPPSSCPGAALELVSRFELTMRRCAKKPRDRARDPGRRGARAARSEAPPETGSRTPRGSSRASAVARSVPPNPDPIRERPDPGAPERFFAVRLPRRDAQTVEKPKWKREAARTHRSACSASLALYTSSARDNPDRSSATFIRLIVRDRRETPHSTPARVRSVAQKAHPIARNVVGKNVGAKKANESSGNTPRFSSQRVLLTRRLRGRFFATSIGGRSRTRFRAVSTGVKESGSTRFARHFSPGARTQRHLPPWSWASFCSRG